MANIVVLVGSYHPYYNANGNIARNIIDELKEENEVKVIALKNKFNLSYNCKHDGYEIIRINDFWTCLHNYFVDRQQDCNKLLKWCYQLLLQIKRVCFFIKRLLRMTSIDKSIIKKQLYALEKLSNKFNIEVIIPISPPFENIISAIEYKKTNKSVRILPFQLDNFSNADTLHNFKIVKKMRYHNHIKIEKKCIELSKCFFILPFMKEHYTMKIFNIFEKKIIVCELPLIKEKRYLIENNVSLLNKECINLVFAGTLNIKRRNPSYLFELLKIITSKNNTNICLNIFHFGDCDDLINNYQKDLRNQLMNYGAVPLEDAFNAMFYANILVSIGVTNTDQIGSKIFDYFSFGKPIIHFYFSDNDPDIAYLDRYPMSLSIKIDNQNLQRNSEKLLEFCKQYYDKTVPFDEVQKIFYGATPEYVASEIKRFIYVQNIL